MLPNKSRNAKPDRLDARQAYGGMFFKSEIVLDLFKVDFL
jgi:hypothetical protein